jgi:hypothetical protein
MTNQFAKETGRAWGIAYKKVKRLHDWVAENVPMSYQTRAFTTLLRRHQNSNR